MFKVVKPFLLFVVLTFLFSGCASEIGDSCESSNDCAQGQECDTSFPDGYCTVFNCEEGKCPEEAVCVDFSPFFYKNCMKKCSSSSDCRDGYSCIEKNGKKFCGVLDENNN